MDSHPLGQSGCVAAHSVGGVAAHANGNGVGAGCAVTARGTFIPGNGNKGPYCGYLRGPANFTVTVGGVTESLAGLSVQHAGDTLLWAVLEEGKPLDQGGGGVGAMELAQARGNCGLDPTDGFPRPRSSTSRRRSPGRRPNSHAACTLPHDRRETHLFVRDVSGVGP